MVNCAGERPEDRDTPAPDVQSAWLRTRFRPLGVSLLDVFSPKV